MQKGKIEEKNCSDLLKHERLAFPVPPPEPVNDKKRMVAILPYTKMPDTDEITFQVMTNLKKCTPYYYNRRCLELDDN